MPIFGAEMIIFCLKIVWFWLVYNLYFIYVGILLSTKYTRADLNERDVTFLGRVDGNLVGVFIYFIFSSSLACNENKSKYNKIQR